MSFLALCPQIGNIFRAQGGYRLGNLMWGGNSRNPSSLSGTQKFLREVRSENFHPYVGFPLRKPYDKMSELRSRKIRGLYTLYRKILLFGNS